MADTITIAGKPYPKVIVIGGGLAVVGIVGYAYFTRSSGGPEIEAEVLVPEEPTGVLPFGGTQSGTFTEGGPVAYRNDQEWFAAAIDELLLDYGVSDTPTASDALQRYLSNTPLTAAQVAMLNFVINTIGPPPSGPRTIKKETAPGGGVSPPPTVPALTAPTITATKSPVKGKPRMRFVWAGVAGATGYDVARGDSVTGKMGGATKLTADKRIYDWTYRIAGERLLLFVRARGANNTYGPWASLMAIG